VSDKKFAIETEADIGKGFETLDGELGDLKKKTDELVAKIEASENVIDDVTALGKDLKTLREDFAKASSKLVTRDGGPATRLPCSLAEFHESGIKALHQAPTKVAIRNTAQGKRIDPEGDPFGEWQKAGDGLQVFTAALSAADNRKPKNPAETMWYDRVYKPAAEKAESILKAAMDTATAAPGIGNWIPTEMSTQLEPLIATAYRVLGEIRSVTLPRSPFDWPRQVGRTSLYYRTEEPVAPPASRGGAASGTVAEDALGTTSIANKVQFSGKTISGVATVSEDAEQDAIFALVPFLTGDLAESYARAQEDAAINGDFTAGTQDSDLTATIDHRLTVDGFRYFGLAAGTALSAGGNNLDSMANWGSYVRDQIAKMGGYGDLNQFGNNPDDLVLLVNHIQFNEILKIAEFMQLNTAGQLATIGGVNANVAFRPNGLRMIVSDFMRDDLNASGVYDGVTVTKDCSIILNRMAWLRAQFRAPRVQVFTDSYFKMWGQTGIQIDGRWDLQAVKDPTAATQTHTNITYNYGA
jgi:HK97 family phage major capsid protein